jgi:hypothetical protein
LAKIFANDNIVLVAGLQYPIGSLAVAWQVVLTNAFQVLPAVNRAPKETGDVGISKKTESDSDLLHHEDYRRVDVAPFIE